MSIRDDFFAAKAQGSLWDVAVSIKRGNPLPLDADSIFASYEALEAYAADVLAYPGQVVAVVNEDSTGIYYLDQNLAIKPVGVIPTGDGKSIEVTADGVISLAGIADAESLTLPRMKADKSGIEWVPVSAVVQGDGNDNTTYEFTALEDKVGFNVVTKFNGEQVGDAVEFAFDVYTKSEADDKFLAKADYTPYDDTALADRVKAIEDDYLVEADKYDDTALKARVKAIEDDYLVANDIVNKADKATTLAGYGIGDAYTKDEVDGAIDDAVKGLLGENVADAYDTLKEIQDLLAGTDGEAIDGLIEIADANKKAIEVLNGDADKAGSVDAKIAAAVAPLATSDALDKVRQLADAAQTADEVAASISAAITDANLGQYAVAETVNAALELKANAADVDDKFEALEGEIADTYAKKETTLAGYGIADAYTAAQTDAAILAKIGEMTGGESAADVLALLNAYKASNDREVWGDDFVNNATVDGKYTPDYAGNSRIDDLKTKLDTVENNAEVNIIEVVKVNGVALTPDADRAVDVIVPTSITGMDGYSALDARVTAAKAQADKGVTDAAAAAAKADVNTEEIGKHATRIESLETAKSDYATRIKTLEDKETEHSAAYTSLKGIVDGHTTTIAGKADQSALDAVIAKAGANEQAIKTLNETTIPGVNAEIAKKANSADVYTKTEVEGLITASKYDDTAVKGLITAEANRADTEEKRIVGLVEAEASRADAEEKRIVGLVEAEAARAKLAEATNAEEIARVNAVLAAALENEDDKALNSIKELALWVEEHGEDAAEMAEAIGNNADAIKAIYDASGEKATGILVEEIARVEKKADDNALAIEAINHSTTGILALANAYTNEKIANVPVADGDTIIVNEKKLSVAKVSTDILAQGEYELILCGGTAAGHVVAG